MKRNKESPCSSCFIWTETIFTLFVIAFCTCFTILQIQSSTKVYLNETCFIKPPCWTIHFKKKCDIACNVFYIDSQGTNHSTTLKSLTDSLICDERTKTLSNKTSVTCLHTLKEPNTVYLARPGSHWLLGIAILIALYLLVNIIGLPLLNSSQLRKLFKSQPKSSILFGSSSSQTYKSINT